MIANVKKGNRFEGLIKYLTKGGRGQVLAFHNLASETPEVAASEMAIAAAQSKRTMRPVMHISISYAQTERPTVDQMRADALNVISSMGLSENQAVIIAHDDRNHTHFHIAVNRVGPNGKAVSDSNSYARIEYALRMIETDRGWRPVEGRNAVSPTTAQRMIGPSENRKPYRIDVPERVRRALLEARTWKHLHQEIDSAGWKLDVVHAGKGSGALLTGPNGQKVGTGTVDRAATLSQLRQRLGRNTKQDITKRGNSIYRELASATGAALKGVTLQPLITNFSPQVIRRKKPKSPLGFPRF